MNDKILEYKIKWNNFFKEWDESPKETFDKSVWTKNNNGKGKTELDPFSLPQPYLGNPENCSAITLNLNPGPTSDLRFHKNGILVSKFRNSENYFEYAKNYPQMKLPEHPSHFWNNQFRWISEIIDNKKSPFAIEICPWHSIKWKSLPKVTKELKNFINSNVFEIITEVVKYSELKTVLSVGKTYYNLFQNEFKEDFKKIIEFSPKNHNELKEYNWPKRKNGESSNRFFSVWKHEKTGIMYFNTYSIGSNKPPSKEWNKIQDYILKNYS